jgi:hypothetical protein
MKCSIARKFWISSTLSTLFIGLMTLPAAAASARSQCRSLFSASLENFASTSYLKLSGRTIVYDRFISDPTKVTYILLPGVNRGILNNEPVLKAMRAKKINYVSMQFSAHLDSQIESLKNKQKAISRISLQDLLNETEAVIKENNLINPQIVSLSYSSAVTSLLTKKQAELVIEVAPMGAFNESNQSAQKFDQNMQIWTAFNPLMGMMYNSAKENAYRTYWTNIVTGLKAARPELQDPILFDRTVSSYVALAKASENYNILQNNFSKQPERVFILASQDEAPRLDLQLKAIHQYKSQTGKWPLVYMIQGSGHVVPSDAPLALLNILLDIQERRSNQKLKDSFMASVNLDGTIRWLSNAKAEKIFLNL